MAEAEALASVVRSCHRKLRAATKSGEDVDEVWRDHVRDDDTLVTYAKAMRSLATGPWKEKDNYDRICWCAQACSEYLEHRLEELLLKDHRRQTHGVPTVVHPSLLPSSSSVRALVDDLRRLPLRLLDVGSCYNPFLSLPRFSVTAIDIAPASETVLRCDFLNVDVVGNDLGSDISISSQTMRTDSFDVVVFSLLLSYLPCTKQRHLCCVNAHKVLQPHGLLLLVTPDSSHQNRHASLMVQWKLCIEAVGFHRWKYEKLTHLHCMAFRKTLPTRREYDTSQQQHTLLSIPQDHSDVEEQTL